MTARFCSLGRRIGGAIFDRLPAVLGCAGAALPGFVAWLLGRCL